MSHSSALPVVWIVLRILIVLNWLFAAAIAGLLAYTFVNEEWTFRALGVGAVAGREGIVAGMRMVAVLGIAAAPLFYVIYRQLLKILETVRAGDPFTAENAGRLRIIAWALVALEIVHIAVVSIAAAVSTKELPLRVGDSLNVTPWLAILLLFVLAEVFREGSRMRDDLEGTV